MKIYYAHPMSWYNTQHEVQDISRLTELGEVLNPNNPQLQEAAKAARTAGGDTMKPFRDALRSCDVVAYRPFLDGKIGAGIALEVLDALTLGKHIISLPTCEESLFDMGNVLTIAETRARLRAAIR